MSTSTEQTSKPVDRLRAAKTLKTANRWHVGLPTGPHSKIGSRDLMVGYSRKGGVLVRLFYPAKDGEQGSEQNPLLWSNWFPHEYYKQGYADVAGVRSDFLKNFIERINSKKNVFIPTIPNARIALPPGGHKYPVIVFSHGLGACRTTYSTLCCELASHGFVVAAVEHRDNSACLSFYAKRALYSLGDSNPDFFAHQVDGKGGDEKNATVGEDQVDDAQDEVDLGDEVDDPNYIPPKALSPITSIQHLKMAWVRHRRVPLTNHTPQCYRFRNLQIQQRVRECTRALDLLEALNAGYELENLLEPGFNRAEFETLLDLDRAIIAGHSFGGATALMTAAAEIRFKVVIALDAWAFPIKDEPLDLISQPVMMINTETMTGDEPNVRKLSEVMRTIEGDDRDRRQSVTINGSKHFQQCDVPLVLGRLALWLSGQSVGRTSISTLSVHDLTAALMMQFIYKFLGMPSNPTLAQYLTAKKKRFRLTYPN